MVYYTLKPDYRKPTEKSDPITFIELNFQTKTAKGFLCARKREEICRKRKNSFLLCATRIKTHIYSYGSFDHNCHGLDFDV